MPAPTIGFRPTDEERRLLKDLAAAGWTTTDALRRGLQLVAHELWVDRARAEAEMLSSENLNEEPDAW